MTNFTIQHMAKEFAGEFYESRKRSPTFRARYPNPKVYTAQCWPLWVPAARHVMVKMLTQPHVHQHLKDGIFEALLDDRERQLRDGAKKLPFAPGKVEQKTGFEQV